MSSTASRRKAKKRVDTTSKRPPLATAPSSAGSKAKGRLRASTSDTLFADLGFSSEEARVLTIKSDLCNQILKLVRERGYTQKELAKIWGKPQPRVSEILNCKISLFSIDVLVTYLGQLGADVTVKVARGKAAS